MALIGCIPGARVLTVGGCAVALGALAVTCASPASAKITVEQRVLHSFGNAPGDGWQPWGSPTFANGKLWGRTTYGGPHNQGGVIWTMDPAKPKKSYKLKHKFGGTAEYRSSGNTIADLANPHHDWMRQRGNLLFGAAMLGGPGGQGGVFKYNMRNGNYKILHAFTGQSEFNPNGSLDDGANPHSNAVPINAGKGKDYLLIGMTAAGGQSATGSLYQLRPGGGHFKMLHSFTAATGDTPHGFVTQIGHRIYGMTRYGAIAAPESAFPDKVAYKEYKHGNGVVFMYNLKNRRYKVLHQFGYTGPLSSGPGSNTADGSVPFHGGLTVVKNRLWGATTLGGAKGGGVIFSIRPDGTGYRIEHTFGSPTGTSAQSQQRGSLILGPDNLLYGLTTAGGSAGVGGTFRIDPKTGSFKKLFDFSGAPGAAVGLDDPVVTKDSKGHIVLYGMTKDGGKVISNLTPTPIAGDWYPIQPANANGTIWKAVIHQHRHSKRK